jgi:hypothetical protein
VLRLVFTVSPPDEDLLLWEIPVTTVGMILDVRLASAVTQNLTLGPGSKHFARLVGSGDSVTVR